MAKHSTTTACKAAIPALLVSYSASVQAGVSPSDDISAGTDRSNKPSRQTLPASADLKPRLVTVVNAGEQLDQYHYKGGKIDLNKVGFRQLQKIMDSFAKDNCAHAVQSACRWKVLKLERTGRGNDGEQLSSISAVMSSRDVGHLKYDKPKAATPVNVALHSSHWASLHDKGNKSIPIPTSYRPQVITPTVEQRVTPSEWAQSFSAPHPDDTAIAAELTTPVAIDLPQRSEVKMVVNGHEEASEIMDAGRRVLDTTSLPEGSYPIEIHVTNKIDGKSIIRQMFGRRHLVLQQPTTSYGVFRQEPLNRRNAKPHTTRKGDKVLHATVVTSLDSTSECSAKVSISGVSRTADVTLARRGNQYRLSLDGAISSQSALGNALKATYLGKDLTLTFQGIGFVPAREMTGDPALASFLGSSEHGSFAKPVWHRGNFVFPLVPIRHQDPSNGLVESRAKFATRLAHAVASGSASKRGLQFQFVNMNERGAMALTANFDTRQVLTTPIRPTSKSELEIETPFINLA